MSTRRTDLAHESLDMTGACNLHGLRSVDVFTQIRVLTVLAQARLLLPEPGAARRGRRVAPDDRSARAQREPGRNSAALSWTPGTLPCRERRPQLQAERQACKASWLFADSAANRRYLLLGCVPASL